MPKIFESRPKDPDHARDFFSVVLHLGVAIGEAINRLVLFQAIFLVGKPLDELVELGAKQERDVADSEEAAALRAVNLFTPAVGNIVNDELPLTTRTLEDFRNHGFPPSLRSERLEESEICWMLPGTVLWHR